MLKYFDRLKKFDYMVRHSITGTPKECAKKLEISRSRFYEFLEDLKLLDIPVEYDKDLRTYTYKKPGVLKLGFEERHQTIEKEELEDVKGGKFSNLSLFINRPKFFNQDRVTLF